MHVGIEQAGSPVVDLKHLDHLWFQVSGTHCNLRCAHCFISCAPDNHAFGYLSLDDVERALDESAALGVKEYFFTGGEPFLHRDLPAMLRLALAYGPATVLTNATLFRDEDLSALAEAESRSLYSLEFRVSIDGFTPQMNDPVRGSGTFARAMRGVEQLARRGFLPILTAVRTWSERDDAAMLAGFVESLRAIGCDRPRIKLLPALRLGAEVQRSHGYASDERVTHEMLDGYDTSHLVCEHSRVVTDRGVYVCPILLDAADARLGSTVAQAAAAPFALSHGACFTCYQYGAICSNPSAGGATLPSAEPRP